jgi:hypothetical protein
VQRRPERCVVANWTSGYGAPRAYGWDDKHCGRLLPFICKAKRALHQGGPALPGGGCSRRRRQQPTQAPQLQPHGPP